MGIPDMIIKTPEDWWTEYLRIQQDIKDFTGAHEMQVKTILEHPLAEQVMGENTLKVYQEYPDLKVYEVWDILRDKRDARLWYILNGVWADAPDHIRIHGWPSWGAFCDLCSEGHVFEEELMRHIEPKDSN